MMYGIIKNGKVEKATAKDVRNAQLKAVMKKAWEIKKQDKRNVWSECLKMAWSIVKGLHNMSKKIGIKTWFQDKLMKENNAYINDWSDDIVRETEKAVCIHMDFETKTGVPFSKNVWVPKSCLA
jgi:hypothetical protein